MTRYAVRVVETIVKRWTVEVEAADWEEAEEKARGMSLDDDDAESTDDTLDFEAEEAEEDDRDG